MKKYTKEELTNILKLHSDWLNNIEGGIRADLSNANLSNADLSDTDLSNADLINATLWHATLSGANLYRTNLSRANLSYVDLRRAKLHHANLSKATLRHANLNEANLYVANLSEANLSGVNLRLAYLSTANLTGVDLSGANLTGANLRGANLTGVKHNYLTAFYALQCPEEGSFIGWKSARECIIKLKITEDAKRSSATTRKCRCSKAEVLEITRMSGCSLESVSSDRRESFKYVKGETVEVYNFDDDRWNECSMGIHFFMTREEAENWMRKM